MSFMPNHSQTRSLDGFEKVRNDRRLPFLAMSSDAVIHRREWEDRCAFNRPILRAFRSYVFCRIIHDCNVLRILPGVNLGIGPDAVVDAMLDDAEADFCIL